MATLMVALESALESPRDPGVGPALESAPEPTLDLGVGMALESALGSALDPSGEATEGGLGVADGRYPRQAEAFGELDRRLLALCRERGPLRAVLARIASRLVFLRAWERIGYARLSDYAVERLGLSARSVRSLAEVGTRLGERPGVQDALVSGRLGWTKVRLLARLPQGEDEAAWIGYARQVTAEELSKAVRAVDRGSVEAGGAEEAGARSRLFEVRCTPEVRWKWLVARAAAARAAGRVLHLSEAAELIAAEVLSALPIDEGAEEGACEEAGVSWSGESEPVPESELEPDPAGLELCETGSVGGEGATTALAARHPSWGAAWRGNEAHRHSPWRMDGAGSDRADAARPPRLARPSIPQALAPFLKGLDEADAFALDERFRRALPWSNASRPASAPSSLTSGGASCTGRSATRVAKPTHASAWEWTPHARGPSCVSSARPPRARPSPAPTEREHCPG